MEATKGIVTYWWIVMAGQQLQNEGMCKARLSDHLDKQILVPKKVMHIVNVEGY